MLARTVRDVDDMRRLDLGSAGVGAPWADANCNAACAGETVARRDLAHRFKARAPTRSTMRGHERAKRPCGYALDGRVQPRSSALRGDDSAESREPRLLLSRSAKCWRTASDSAES